MQCISLKNVIFPESLTDIEDGAFFNCNLLDNINLPNILKIGELAFCDCKSLKNVTLPNISRKTFIKIDKTAFCGCDLLEDVNWI